MNCGIADQARHRLGVGGECLLAVVTGWLVRDLEDGGVSGVVRLRRLGDG